MGRNNATTFTGLCADHDADLFRPIDTNEIDLSSDEHLFLLSYRAVLKEAYMTRKSAIDTQLTYQRGIEGGLLPKRCTLRTRGTGSGTDDFSLAN